MKRWLALAPLIALGGLVALSLFLLARSGERDTFTTGVAGRAAPNYALARLDGGPSLTDADMRGRAYVINLFASWCTPCRVEHAQLMALEAGGVEIVGVAYKDAPGAAANFLHELGDPYRAVVLDPEGRFALELGIMGVPETFVIGEDGTIRAAHRGPLTPDIVQSMILPALTD